ncbi:MAG: UDP-N-acetylmuramoyl-L-alanyl-D-glutamate--2,6-diaminopimelate ligase [Pseudomonadota bacterium]
MSLLHHSQSVPRHAGLSTPSTRAVDWRALNALHMTRLVSDSRHVLPGDTFVAYRGEALDARAFIPAAIERGAASVLWERADFKWRPSWKVKNASVLNLKRHAGEIASDVYGRPSDSLWMIGVTGTNGKTSCSQWIAQALTRMNKKCGVIGTLGSGTPTRLTPLDNTTPDAVWLQWRLREFVRQRMQVVSMEVSSHGLSQHRVSGVKFDVALFTNLTRDHLDYHGTLRNYRNAKARLFRASGLKTAVLNLDDRSGAALVERTQRRGVTVLGYGFNRALPPALRGRKVPRLTASSLRMGADGLAFKVSTPWGAGAIRSSLIGRFNAANLLGTLAVLLASDQALEESIYALERVSPVAGRTERYGGGRHPLVVVDYAHTPDALENVLLTLRELIDAPDARRGKLVCVFGCGGDRDRGKRALMGRIATTLADEVIVTSDNPRSENPRTIIQDILAGTTIGCAVIEERAQAIHMALAHARAADIVLIAGKGHEQYQEIAGVRHPFSDAVVVRRALAKHAS